jgi:hypothetical protein
MTKLSTTFSLLSTLAACGSLQPSELPDGGQVPSGPDAGTQVPSEPDAGTQVPPDGGPMTARCDPGKPFAAPTLVAGINSVDHEIGFALTRDERAGFITRMVTDGTSLTASLLAIRRGGLSDPFGAAVADATSALNDVYGEELLAFPTRDGLALYFSRQVESDLPQLQLGTRATVAAAFGAERAVQLDGSPVTGESPVLSGDDQRLYWVDAASARLRSATRQGAIDTFATPLDLTTDEVANPVLSADELTLYSSADGDADIVVATRPATTAAFGAPTPVAGVNSAERDAPVYLTADGCVLYLKSTRSGGVGGMDVWQAQRPR